MPGVDLVLPDFTYLRENADRVEAILLTHAHEDHAGGLAFLLRDISVPIYGSALSLALARNRIEEAGMLDRTELIPVDRRRAPPDRADRLPVHPGHALGARTASRSRSSRPRARSSTPATSSSTSRRSTAAAPTSRCSARSRAATAASGCCMSDSTNAERPGFTPSESTVGAAMRVAVPRAPRQAVHRRELRVAPAPGAAGRAGRDRATAARSRSSGGRCCRTSRWRASAASSTCPTYGGDRHRGGAQATRPARSASSAPARRASR